MWSPRREHSAGGQEVARRRKTQKDKKSKREKKQVANWTGCVRWRASK